VVLVYLCTLGGLAGFEVSAMLEWLRSISYVADGSKWLPPCAMYLRSGSIPRHVVRRKHQVQKYLDGYLDRSFGL
jgi:hypothetical protein